MDAVERAAVRGALGRMFRLMTRPEQPGDVAEYERCRRVVLDAVRPQVESYRPSWARDRLKGAQGDGP